MSRLAFFIGKGGVGKTTVSAAYAVRAAAAGRSVLLMSTDPAHSLADVFEMRLAATPRAFPMAGRGRLELWQIDAARQFDRFLRQYREPILKLVESGTIFSRSEIEPLLDSTVPGMAELSALLALDELLAAGQHSEIVVDTAPLGHTLQFFEMPQHFARFLDFLEVAGSRDRILAQRFGGGRIASHPFLQTWRRMVVRVEEALRAPGSRIVLVTTPETFALNESVRAAEILRASGLAVSGIVVNRVVERAGSCRACRLRAQQARAARQFLRREFAALPAHIGLDGGAPVVGREALLAFARHVFDGAKLRATAALPKLPVLEFEPVPWPELETPLSLTVGKGGVGKTTVSAALAFQERHRRRARAVTICSTDPAPSLDDIFQKPVGEERTPVLGDPRFRAIELDAVAEFRRWSSEVKRKIAAALRSDVRGVHVDLSFDREVISALLDVVPPGVNEIFAIFRILDLLGSGREALVIDMAPTGHALQLLRMPARMQRWARLLLKSLAAHRTLPLAQDAAVEIAEVEQRVRELASLLKDGKRARVWPVMLAEPLPDRETARLLRQLEELGASTAPVFVNRVIFAEDAKGCARCRRASAWQTATLLALRRRAGRLWVARNFDHEIAGRRGLDRFTSELWQIV